MTILTINTVGLTLLYPRCIHVFYVFGIDKCISLVVLIWRPHSLYLYSIFSYVTPKRTSVPLLHFKYHSALEKASLLIDHSQHAPTSNTTPDTQMDGTAVERINTSGVNVYFLWTGKIVALSIGEGTTFGHSDDRSNCTRKGTRESQCS